MALKKFNIRLSKLWVLVVSAMSVALVACVCSKKSAEKKQQQENITVMQMELDSLRKVQEHRNAVAIYGTPDVMKRYGEENARLQQRIDSLQTAIDEIH